MRRIARNHRLSRTTVDRKLIFLGLQARFIFENDVKNRFKNIDHFIFDEMETFEHSKYKPVSIHVGVTKDRHIVGFNVCKMPPKGAMAKAARKKYGPRPDERGISREKFLKSIEPLLAPNALVESDQNPHYASAVKKHLPGRVHKTFKGRRAAATGQGELKEGVFDPLFALNHACAMARANMSRLLRKTWCTTKKIDRLYNHFCMYAVFHNRLVDEHLERKRKN